MIRTFSLFFTLIILSSCTLPAQKKAEQLQEKARELMIKDSSICDFFSISDEGIFLYPEANSDSAEFFLAYDEIDAFNRLYEVLPRDSALYLYQQKGIAPYPSSLLNSLPESKSTFSPGENKTQALSGLRVALDPGHLGGSMEMAELEKKYMKIKANPAEGIPYEIAFNEGNLALATAYVIREKLQKAGAEVLLTREGKGNSAFGYSFD